LYGDVNEADPWERWGVDNRWLAPEKVWLKFELNM